MRKRLFKRNRVGQVDISAVESEICNMVDVQNINQHLAENKKHECGTVFMRKCEAWIKILGL